MKGTVIYKMTGSGNDFVFVDGRVSPIENWTLERVRAVCARRTGVGADGLVVLGPGSGAGAVSFQYFNSDGSPAPMCGNAALCATRMAAWLELAPADDMVLETESGPLRARCIEGEGELAQIAVPEPEAISVPRIDLSPGERAIALTAVGVPHLVVLVDQIEDVPLIQRGPELRSHPAVGQGGANVNFVAPDGQGWSMRTYERGVEAETLACGTGAVAAAAVLQMNDMISLPWSVRSRSGAVLTVTARVSPAGRLSGPKLTGEARLVFRAILGELPT